MGKRALVWIVLFAIALLAVVKVANILSGGRIAVVDFPVVLAELSLVSLFL